MEEDYWKMGNLSLETYEAEVGDVTDSENDLLRSVQVAEDHFDAKVERCDRVVKILAHQFSQESNKSAFPFSIESYRYIEPANLSTMRDVTDFSFQIVFHCNDNSSLFVGLINILHDILIKNSERLGICPLSINIVKKENVIRLKFLGDDGFFVNLCLAPAENHFNGTGETQVLGQNS